MIELKVLKRDLQDSNEYLRSQGLVPAIFYGSDFESTPVSVNDIEFRKVYREAGTSHIITTTGEIAGEMCVVQEMQVHVVSGDLLHLDFKVVNKGETTEIAVPITLVGESPAEKDSLGVVNFANETATIETIPSKIPDHLEADISILVALGDSIKMQDLKLPEGVKLIDDGEMTVVNIVIPKENEEEEEEVVSDSLMEPEMVDQKGKGEEEGVDAEKPVE